MVTTKVDRAEDLQVAVLRLFERQAKAKRRQTLTLAEICERLDKSPGRVQAAVEALRETGHNISPAGGSSFHWGAEVRVGARSDALIVHDPGSYRGGWRKFGAIGDTHFGSRHERLDVVEALYDRFAEEGVTEVYHTGNWIEGEARFNFSDIKVFGLDDQVDYGIKVWPRRPGITTYYVSGDDHEGWYQQRTRLVIGKHFERKAREAGRDDLVYLGYMEGHVELVAPKGKAHMLVMHPGGGSAYAESYAPQKIAEAFQEGEKPDVCLVGHYHKMGYGLHRGIHMLQTGTGQDQSTFMRKKKIKAAVGGAIVELHQAPEGHVNRFKPEFFTFFDRDFYAKKRNWLG